MRRSTLLLFIGASACGGVVSAGDAGDAGLESLDGPGWTTCAAPDKSQVCRGPNQCPDDNACGGCLPVTGNDLGLCASSLLNEQCPYEDDGFVCVESEFPNLGVWTQGTFNLGGLFAKNGAADRVRYADFGLWTGEAIPNPLSCPTLTSALMCGGCVWWMPSKLRLPRSLPTSPQWLLHPPHWRLRERHVQPSQQRGL